MRFGLLLAIAACADPAPLPEPIPPKPIDIPPDPFVGAFDGPDDLPRDGCAPGSLAGFADRAYWPTLAMRSAEDGIYIANEPGDLVVEPALTADDLFIRATIWNGSVWHLRVIAACAYSAGTLAGHELTCTEGEECTANAFVAEPLRRRPDEQEADGLGLVGEFHGDWPGGVTRGVRVQQRTAYLARGLDGVRVISVADPRAPRELAHHQEGDVADVEPLRAFDGLRYLVVAATPHSYVLDVDDPSAPARVALIAAAAHAVSVDGTTAYFVEDTRIAAFDLSDPRKPRRLATHDGAAPQHAFAANGIVYLADVGIHAVDFREGAPRALAASTTHATDSTTLTTLDGRTVVVSAGHSELHLLDGDVAAQTFLVTLGTYGHRAHAPLHDVRAIDDRIYVAAARDGIRVIEIMNPHAPAAVGYFNTWREGTGSAAPLAGAVGIDVDRALDRIYVADTVRGLVILGET